MSGDEVLPIIIDGTSGGGRGKDGRCVVRRGCNDSSRGAENVLRRVDIVVFINVLGDVVDYVVVVVIVV